MRPAAPTPKSNGVFDCRSGPKMDHSSDTEGLRNAGLAIIAVGVVVAGLVYGRTFLLPLAISILVWNLLEAMIERFASIRFGDFQVPRWLAANSGNRARAARLLSRRLDSSWAGRRRHRSLAALRCSSREYRQQPHPIARRRAVGEGSESVCGYRSHEASSRSLCLRPILCRHAPARRCVCGLPVRGKAAT